MGDLIFLDPPLGVWEAGKADVNAESGGHMSYSLNSLKGDYIGDYIG